MPWLRINENKIIPENAFNGNYLGNGEQLLFDNDQKTLLKVFLKIFDSSFNL